MLIFVIESVYQIGLNFSQGSVEEGNVSYSSKHSQLIAHWKYNTFGTTIKNFSHW